jgi:hypothetical protein
MRVSALLFFILLTVCGGLAAQTWDETTNGGGDAGELVATAQVPQGSGPITTITGTFVGTTGTDVDVYRVKVVNFTTFQASLLGVIPPPDTQIFLFDGNGIGIAYSDDWQTTYTGGHLPANDPLYNTRPVGEYLIGVAEYDLDPVSASGAIFGQAYPGVFGATGPGAAQPYTAWQVFTNAGAGGGAPYTLTLDGCEFIVPPEIDVEFASLAVADGGSVNCGTVNTNGLGVQGMIFNTGLGELSLTGSPMVVVTPGTNCDSGTAAQQQPASALVAPSGNATFVVFVDPTTPGPFSFTISIANNDSDENPYDFTVNGTAVLPNGAAEANPAAGSLIMGGTNGPFSLDVDPGATLADATIELSDMEADNIVVISIAPIGPAPSGINQPAIPAQGHPIILEWTGVAEAVNTPGPYLWSVDFRDTVNLTVENFELTITIPDRPPTHSNAGALSGTGSAGDPYRLDYTQGDNSSLITDFAALSDPNSNQSVSLGPVTPGGANPAGGAGFQFGVAAGVLSVAPAGTLTAADAGTHTFDVQVTDGTSFTTIAVSIQVYSTSGAITFTTPANLPDAVLNEAYAQTLQVSGATGATTFSISSGSLPGGMALSPAGEISGAPLALGVSTLTVRVADSANEAAFQQFQLSVVNAAPPSGPDTSGGGSSGGCASMNSGAFYLLALLGAFGWVVFADVRKRRKV